MASAARIALLAFAAMLASCASAPRKEAAPASSQPPSPPAAVNPGGITFAAVGDIMMGTDYPDNVLPDDDGVGFLANVTPVIAGADIAFGNLEGVLMDGGEAVKRCKPSKARPNATPVTPPTAAPGSEAASSGPDAGKTSSDSADTDMSATPAKEADAQPDDLSDATADSTSASAAPAPTAPSASGSPPTETPLSAGSCFVFRSPTRYAKYLRDAGFDVASLANNHAQDFGDPGRDSTMRALDEVGIRHSGRDGDVAEWTTRGRKFALVAFAPNVGSHQLNELDRARHIVLELAARHDIVIVSFHGGSEGEGASKLPFAHELYAGEDRGDVVEFAHAVIDAGADLVIGHGPHVLRAVELYKDRLVAYSLGNFATYYGISVNGIRGIAGVLVTRLADDGRFMDAHLAPTVQIRPAGPSIDPERRAITRLRELTNEAFPTGKLGISDDGFIRTRLD